MNTAAFRKLALSLDEVSEHPHFDRFAFKTTRRTFATLSGDGKDVNIKLEPDQQAMLVASASAFTKIPNKWGDAGWTTCVLPKVTVKQLEPVLREAHAVAMLPPPAQLKKRRR